MELDAVGMADAGDIRYRLVQQLLREGAKRGAARFHVACADMDGNVELLMQAGFMRYGEERILRAAGRPVPARPVVREARRAGRHPAGDRPSTRWRCRGCTPSATPAPVARLEAIRLADWERQGGHWRVPRSSLAPILRFADVEAFVAGDARRRPGRHRARRPGPGRRREGGPAALPEGRRAARAPMRPPSSPSDWASSPQRTTKGADRRSEHGSSRPCEPTSHRSTGAWRMPASIRSPASTLLMKETLVRVAEPALVPAGVR